MQIQIDPSFTLGWSPRPISASSAIRTASNGRLKWGAFICSALQARWIDEAVVPYYSGGRTRDNAAGRDVVCYDRAGANHGAVTDGDAREDYTMCANPNIVLDDNRFREARPVHHSGRVIVRQGCNGDVRRYHDPVPDLDAAHPVKLKEGAN
jgi:hypothetical protein